MAITKQVGETITFTAQDLDAASGVDPNATNTWLEVDGALDADGNSTGVSASTGFIGSLSASGNPATATADAAGSTFVASLATDPDGNTKWSPPYAVTIEAAAPSTDTTSVVISAA